MGVVGQNVPRVDGAAKASGTARYVDDITLPGMLHGRTIRTTIPCGRITDVRLEFDPAGFTVADWRDIPGENCITHVTEDQPCLVRSEVRHVAEPVLLLAHEDRDALRAARVHLAYERGQPLLDPLRSTQVHKRILIERGDLARGFRAADLVVEGEYRTGHQAVQEQGVVSEAMASVGVVLGLQHLPESRLRQLDVQFLDDLGWVIQLPAGEAKVAVDQLTAGLGFVHRRKLRLAASVCPERVTVGVPAGGLPAIRQGSPPVVRWRS
jgi:hypothetical protein